MSCRRTTALFAFALIVALTGPATAQILYGWDYADGVNLIAPGANCPERPVCQAPPPLLPHAFPAGGADWDTCTNSFWVTDGRNIVNLDKQCNVRCAFVGPVGVAPWTGLAVDSVNRLVYTSDPGGVITQWRIVGGTVCLQLVGRCQLPLPTPLPGPITGLAYDAFNSVLWVVDAVGNAYRATPPAAGICTITCRFQMQCPTPVGGRVTGLAYDSCASNLIMYMEAAAAPGGVLINNAVNIPGICGRTTGCCVITSAPGVLANLSGLAYEPGKPAPVTTIPGCSSPPCPPCRPTIGSTGNPALGTTCFTVTLGSLPCPSSAFLVASVGPCAPIGVPGLCGPLFINPATIVLVLSAVVPPCPAPCAGTVSFTIPLPLAQILCGLPLCFQGAAACPGGGLSLTTGLSVTLVGP